MSIRFLTITQSASWSYKLAVGSGPATKTILNALDYSKYFGQEFITDSSEASALGLNTRDAFF